MLDNLEIDEMLALTAPLVEASQMRDAFLSVPEIAPLHAKVVQAHEALVASKVARSPQSPQNDLKALLEEETVVDARHDHLARGIHLAFEAHMHFLLSQDPPDFSKAALCQQAQRKLFPMGLAIINASLLAESGNTARVGRMLRHQEKALAEFLSTVPALSPKKTLRDMVDAWIDAGTSLAELEHKRSSLMAKEGAMVGSASPQAAKKGWIRIVSQILLTLGMSDALPEIVHILRAPFEEAIERASLRMSASSIADEPTIPA
jgi:hypothetical protein